MESGQVANAAGERDLGDCLILCGLVTQEPGAFLDTSRGNPLGAADPHQPRAEPSR